METATKPTTETASAPVILTEEQEAELQKRNELDRIMLDATPKRSDPKYAAGADGDYAHAKDLENFNEYYFNDPDKLITEMGLTFLAGEDLERIKQMALDRATFVEMHKEKLKAAQSKAAESVAKIDPTYFGSNMTEHDVEILIRYGTIAQIKALLNSDQWQMDEKRLMLKPRWEKEVTEFGLLDARNREWKDKMAEIQRRIGTGQMEYEIDKKNRIVPKIVKPDPATGKKYALDKVGNKFEMTEQPPLPPELRNWMRNKMTKPEFEIAASIVPEIFSNPSFVQVIRWPMIFKEFRTDENFPYEMRQGMTYLKDADLDQLVNPRDPNYLPENTLEERGRAFDLATTAAEQVEDSEKDRVFREVYRINTLRDSIRNEVVTEWNKGRALGEVPRGRYRGKITYHRLLDKAKGKKMGGNDAHEIMGEKEGFVFSLLREFEAERNKKGVVTDANRELLDYIFCDDRSTDIPRDTSFLSPKYLQLYNELEKMGHDNGVINFPSDKIRNKVAKPKYGDKKDAEEERRRKDAGN